MEHTPETKASSKEVTPLKEEAKTEKFQPMRENLQLSVLKLPSASDREERSKSARFEHQRL